MTVGRADGAGIANANVAGQVNADASALARGFSKGAASVGQGQGAGQGGSVPPASQPGQKKVQTASPAETAPIRFEQINKALQKMHAADAAVAKAEAECKKHPDDKTLTKALAQANEKRFQAEQVLIEVVDREAERLSRRSSISSVQRDPGDVRKVEDRMLAKVAGTDEKYLRAAIVINRSARADMMLAALSNFMKGHEHVDHVNKDGTGTVRSIKMNPAQTRESDQIIFDARSAVMRDGGSDAMVKEQQFARFGDLLKEMFDRDKTFHAGLFNKVVSQCRKGFAGDDAKRVDDIAGPYRDKIGANK